MMRFDEQYQYGWLRERWITSSTVGPAHYSVWTYMGAFPTTATSQVPGFRSTNGSFQVVGECLQQLNAVGTGVNPLNFTVVPKTAHIFNGRLSMTGHAAGGTLQISGDGSTWENFTAASTQVVDVTALVALLSPPTVWVSTSAAGSTAFLKPQGWIENPEEWP